MLDFGTVGQHGNAYFYGNQSRMDFELGYGIAFKYYIPSGRTGTLTNAAIFSQWDIAAANPSGWRLRTHASDSLLLQMVHGDGSGNDTFGTTVPLKENTLYSVFVRWGGPTGAGGIYEEIGTFDVFGVESVSTSGVDRDINSHSNDLSIGRDGDDATSGAAVYAGQIMVWPNYRPTDEEVLQYNLNETLPAPASLGFWVRGTVEPADDLSDFADTGTEQGTVGLFSESTSDNAFQGSGRILPHRARGGRGIRMFRFAPELYTVSVPAEHLDLEIGDKVILAHGSAPMSSTEYDLRRETSLLEDWMGLKCVILSRKFKSQEGRIEFVLWNIKPSLCLHYHSHITEHPGSVDFEGQASVNMGAVVTNQRNSDHFVLGCACGALGLPQQLISIPRLALKTNHEGTIFEPGVANLWINSAGLVDGAGPPALANTTQSLGTGGAVAKVDDDTVQRLFKATSIRGYEVKSVEITKSTDADDYIEWTLTTSSTDDMRILYWTRSFVDYGAAWQLQRNTDNWYYNAGSAGGGTGAAGWQSSAIWNVPTMNSEGEWQRVDTGVIDGIPNSTLDLRIGIPSSEGLSSDTVYFGQGMAYQHWAILTDFVTIGSAFTSDDDDEQWDHNNGGVDTVQTFNPAQGTWRARVRWTQDGDDVPNSTSLVLAEWGVDSDDRDIVAFFKNGSGNWSLNFARYISGSLDVSASVSITSPSVDDVMEVAVTYTSDSENELNQDALSMICYADGVSGSPAIASAEHSGSEQATFYRVGSSLGGGGELPLLNYVFDDELLQYALAPEEVLGRRYGS